MHGTEVRSGYPEGVKVTPRVAACFRWISRGSRCTVCTERDWLEFGFQLALVEVAFVTDFLSLPLSQPRRRLHPTTKWKGGEGRIETLAYKADYKGKPGK